MENFNFNSNFACDVEIQDLVELGWALDESEDYHIELFVDENGKTFCNYVNTVKKANKIWEGSDRKDTGDDQGTIEDIQQLFEQGKLWNCENL